MLAPASPCIRTVLAVIGHLADVSTLQDCYHGTEQGSIASQYRD